MTRILAHPGARACLAVGDLLVHLRQYRASTWCYHGAVRLVPDWSLIQHRLAWALRWTGNLREAESTFTALLEAFPAATGASLDFAMLLQDQDRHIEAIAVLDRALICRERDARLHTLRGVSLERLGHLPDAIGALRLAVALDDSDPDAVLNLGAALARDRRWDEAVKWDTRAMQVRPEATAAYNLGTALMQLNRNAEAEAAFRTGLACKVQPKELTVACGVGVAVAIGRQDRADEALQHAERLLEGSPDDLGVRNALCASLIAVDQAQRALTVARDTVRLHPSHAMAYVSLGWAHLTAEEPDQALAAFERAVLMGEAERRPASQRTHESALAYISDPPEVNAGRGAALSALGRHREAVEAFEQVLAREPHYVERDPLAAEPTGHRNSSLAGVRRKIAKADASR
jgi:tetratricopeptide (TPR) repeat protein